MYICAKDLSLLESTKSTQCAYEPLSPRLGKAGREQLALPGAEEVGGEVGGPGKGRPLLSVDAEAR